MHCCHGQNKRDARDGFLYQILKLTFNFKMWQWRWCRRLVHCGCKAMNPETICRKEKSTPESERFVFIRGNPSKSKISQAPSPPPSPSSRRRRRCHNPSRPRCSSSENANAAGSRRLRHRQEQSSGAARIHPSSPQRSTVEPCATSWLRDLAGSNR